MVPTIIKWVSLPMLLAASMLPRSAASYEFLADLAICLGAVFLIQRAVRLTDFVWAAGFVSTVIVFSPLLLVVKIFLLLGFTCVAASITSLALRMQPVATE
jgi:hypothetical protein